MSRGLRHLAEQGILHRDIALRNILLTNNDVVKVTKKKTKTDIEKNTKTETKTKTKTWRVLNILLTKQ